MTRVPETIEGVKTLLTARKWDKAAIVWSFVKPQQGSRTSSKNRGSYTFAGFADLGIAGLSNWLTVRAYWQRWQDAIDSGDAQPVAPGDEIVAPDLDWPPTGHSHGVDEGMREDATDEEKIKAAEKLIERLPEDAKSKIADDIFREKYGDPPPPKKKQKEEEEKPLISALTLGCIAFDMNQKAARFARIVWNCPRDDNQLLAPEVRQVRDALDLILLRMESGTGDLDAVLAVLAKRQKPAPGEYEAVMAEINRGTSDWDAGLAELTNDEND
jgi:hypothetical protein